MREHNSYLTVFDKVIKFKHTYMFFFSNKTGIPDFIYYNYFLKKLKKKGFFDKSIIKTWILLLLCSIGIHHSFLAYSSYYSLSIYGGYVRGDVCRQNLFWGLIRPSPPFLPFSDIWIFYSPPHPTETKNNLLSSISTKID